MNSIYSTAISVAQDSELRKFVRRLAVRESKLLDSIGSAQVEQEVIKKVMPLLHSQAHNIEEETGIDSSHTDEEAKQHLEDVLAEVRGSKKSRQLHSWDKFTLLMKCDSTPHLSTLGIKKCRSKPFNTLYRFCHFSYFDNTS